MLIFSVHDLPLDYDFRPWGATTTLDRKAMGTWLRGKVFAGEPQLLALMHLCLHPNTFIPDLCFQFP